MSSQYKTFPNEPTIPIKPFKAEIPQDRLDELVRRVKDVPTPRKTYENSHTDESLGVTLDWIIDALGQWKSFDW
jgi:hypothetical protein